MTEKQSISNNFNLNQNNLEKRNFSTPRKSEKFKNDSKYEFDDKFDLNELTGQVFRNGNKKSTKTRSTTHIPDMNKIYLKRNSEISNTINQQNQGNINVICRFRPLNSKEISGSQDLCVDFHDSQNISIKVSSEKNPVKFSFDRIFDMSATQNDVFEFAARPIIESVMEGFNGTIFAYGQTSSGKTHTMQGIIDDPELAGITPRIIDYVFTHISSENNSNVEYKVKISMIEVYMEKINDLLDTNNSNLQIREDKVKGVFVDKLSENYVSSIEEVYELIKIGTTNRAIASTNMNQQSSRSHLIFLMTINQFNTQTFISKTGKLYLVDLAGSEKISKTGATGHVLDEAKLINKSLTTLGMVINNLSEGKGSHVPYRDSKLTRILQESIGGNSKTRLIIACSPSNLNDAETLSTCRFGSRAKNIKNTPKINKEVTVAELKIEIEKLEKRLESKRKRIEQLESFIKYRNFEVPDVEDFSFFTLDTNSFALNFRDIQEGKVTTNEIDSQDHNKCVDVIGITDDKIHKDINQYNFDKYENDLEEKKRTVLKQYEDIITRLREYSSNNEESFKESLIHDIGIIQTKHLNTLDRLMRTNENTLKKLSPQKIEIYRKYSEGKRLLDKSSKKVQTKCEDSIIPQEIYSNVRSLFEYNTGDPRYKLIEFVNCIYSIEKSLNLSYLDEDKSLSSFCNLEIDTNENFTIRNVLLRELEESEEKIEKSKMKSIEEKFTELIEKVIHLESENKELRNTIIPWLENLNSGEKEYVEKTMEMQKKILHLNTVYHQLVSQRSVMKIEKDIIEKKLMKRDERIRTLNEENSELREINKMKDEKLSFIQKTLLKNSDPPNVVKVIRGGRVKSLHSNILNEICNSMSSPPPKSHKNMSMYYSNF